MPRDELREFKQACNKAYGVAIDYRPDNPWRDSMFRPNPMDSYVSWCTRGCSQDIAKLVLLHEIGHTKTVALLTDKLGQEVNAWKWAKQECPRWQIDFSCVLPYLPKLHVELGEGMILKGVQNEKEGRLQDNHHVYSRKRARASESLNLHIEATS